MGRPAEFDRDEAIHRVMEEVWRGGYEPASVKALSERLGITRSSFYNAFGSREDLFRAVLARYLAESPDRMLGTADARTRIRPLLTSLFRSICAIRAKDPEGRGCLAVNSVAELCPAHEALAAHLADALTKSVARIEQLLTWGIESGELPRTTDAHAKALAVKTLLVGINLMCKVVRDERDLWAAAELTLRGLDLYEDTGTR